VALTNNKSMRQKVSKWIYTVSTSSCYKWITDVGVSHCEGNANGPEEARFEIVLEIERVSLTHVCCGTLFQMDGANACKAWKPNLRIEKGIQNSLAVVERRSEGQQTFVPSCTAYLSRSSQSLGFLSFTSTISFGGFTGGLQRKKNQQFFKQNTNKSIVWAWASITNQWLGENDAYT